VLTEYSPEFESRRVESRALGSTRAVVRRCSPPTPEVFEHELFHATAPGNLLVLPGHGDDFGWASSTWARAGGAAGFRGGLALAQRVLGARRSRHRGRLRALGLATGTRRAHDEGSPSG